MKKTIKILSLFVLTSIFIISCDNDKKKKDSEKTKNEKNQDGNKKDDKKDDKKEELTEKEVDFINYADMVCKYQEAIAEGREEDAQKITSEGKIIFQDLVNKYGAETFSSDPEAAKILLDELQKCQSIMEETGEWDRLASDLQMVIDQDMLPEGSEDDEYYDEDEYYEEGDEYYDEDEYYEEEGEGPPGGDWERYMELIEEGYSKKKQLRLCKMNTSK